MKHMKTLGLALMAAAALMAFVGAGTASAATTELFKEATVTLKTTDTITASLEQGTSAVLSTTDESSIVNTCTTSAVDGKITAPVTVVNGPVTGDIEELTFGGCVSTVHTGGTIPTGALEITRIGDVNGDGTVDGTLFGEGSKVTMTLGVSCNYGTGVTTHLGTVTSAKTATSKATIHVNAVINEQDPKSFLCPDTTKWVAKYEVTTPLGLKVGE